MNVCILDMETVLVRCLEVLDHARDCDWCGRDRLNERDRSRDGLAVQNGNGLSGAELIREGMER